MCKILHCAVLPCFVCFCCILPFQVQEAAAVAGSASYRTVGNRDIEHLLDELLHCVARPADVPEVVTSLSGTTFVQVWVALCLQSVYSFDLGFWDPWLGHPSRWGCSHKDGEGLPANVRIP